MTSLVEKFRISCLMRGANGILGIGKLFRIVDDDNDRMINLEEFKKCIREFGLVFSDAEISTLFTQFDEDVSGKINFDEFLIHLRPPLSKRRIDLINRAFDKMDKNKDGVITVEDLVGVYSSKYNPRFINGDWTEAQCFKNFLNTFELGRNEDGVVTKDEFMHYYAAISASIDNDAYFDLMMKQSWKLT